MNSVKGQIWRKLVISKRDGENNDPGHFAVSETPTGLCSVMEAQLQRLSIASKSSPASGLFANNIAGGGGISLHLTLVKLRALHKDAEIISRLSQGFCLYPFAFSIQCVIGWWSLTFNCSTQYCTHPLAKSSAPPYRIAALRFRPFDFMYSWRGPANLIVLLFTFLWLLPLRPPCLVLVPTLRVRVKGRWPSIVSFRNLLIFLQRRTAVRFGFWSSSECPMSFDKFWL